MKFFKESITTLLTGMFTLIFTGWNHDVYCCYQHFTFSEEGAAKEELKWNHFSYTVHSSIMQKRWLMFIQQPTTLFFYTAITVIKKCGSYSTSSSLLPRSPYSLTHGSKVLINQALCPHSIEILPSNFSSLPFWISDTSCSRLSIIRACFKNKASNIEWIQTHSTP